jgi:hypothetical protein
MADNSIVEQWFCTGTGIINMGGPGGQMTLPFSGKGDSQFSAMSDANSNCHSQGVSMCMINSCYKK